MSSLAVFAHLFLDFDTLSPKTNSFENNEKAYFDELETLGT